MKKPNIAVDGYSSTGKSSISKEIAQHLGLYHLDTGSLYRAITWLALQKGVMKSGKIDSISLNTVLESSSFEWFALENPPKILIDNQIIGNEIRGAEVNAWVSQMAEIPEVREQVLSMLTPYVHHGGIIMDGRDVGSVIMPNADIKFFVTASPEERARRRHLELKQNGINIPLEQVLENLLKRDYIDENRKIAPLIQVPDAIRIDTTHMNKEQCILEMLHLIQKNY